MSALGDADPCGKEVASHRLNWRNVSRVFDDSTRWHSPGLWCQPHMAYRTWTSAQTISPTHLSKRRSVFGVFEIFYKNPNHGKLPSLNLTAYEAATDSGDIRCPANEDKKEQRNTARKKQGLSSLSSLRHYKWPVICPAHTLKIKYWSTDLPAFPTFVLWHHFECQWVFMPVVLLCSCWKKRLQQLICSWKHGLQDWRHASLMVPGIFPKFTFLPK